MNLVLGLDLAAVRDYSALAVVERVAVAADGVQQVWVQPDLFEPGWHEERTAEVSHYLVRGLRRWPKGTPPGDVVTDVADLLEDPFTGRDMLLRYDKTGMGFGVQSIIDERFRQGRFGQHRPVGIVLTGAGKSSRTSLTKTDMVSNLDRLFREGRLHISRGLEWGEQLRRELQAYMVKTTPSGREKFEAATESVHDDLVVALGLASWGPWSWHAEPRQWSPEELEDALGRPADGV